mmetsp:Transcript_63321/g.151066  ORF Transcript_63321/g.151066 Transcript_63321/m.151066 type:complete len:264 (+) Transcript_63321:55-846(+)
MAEHAITTSNAQKGAAAANEAAGALLERFSGFERQMEMETRSRKDAEDSALANVKDTIAKLEKTLNVEIKRRVEANKALQGMFESQMATVQDKLEATFLERFDQLHSSVDSLNDRMAHVEKDFTQSREQYVKDIEDKSAMVARDVLGLQKDFQNERSDRKERETLTIAKLRDVEAKAQESFALETEVLEKRYKEIFEDLQESKLVREENDKRFQDYIIEEVASLKNGLVVESQTREQADDDIVTALNHYTQTLQHALRIVNKA